MMHVAVLLNTGKSRSFTWCGPARGKGQMNSREGKNSKKMFSSDSP